MGNYLNVGNAGFTAVTKGIYVDKTELIAFVNSTLDELRTAYPDVKQEMTLPETLAVINDVTGNKFIIIIDEWDALFREAKHDAELQKEYIQLLRGLFKSSLTDKMIEAAYITGILPIKKYGTQSAVTDFREYTMLTPKRLAQYVGFTEPVLVVSNLYIVPTL